MVMTTDDVTLISLLQFVNNHKTPCIHFCVVYLINDLLGFFQFSAGFNYRSTGTQWCDSRLMVCL